MLVGLCWKTDASSSPPPSKKQRNTRAKATASTKKKVEGKAKATASAKKTKIESEDKEHFMAKDRQAWRQWLHENHKAQARVWLIYNKKSSQLDSVRYDEAVEEALCYGWIDSTIRPIDDVQYKQLYTPRKPKSVWSKLNKDRVANWLQMVKWLKQAWNA